MNNAVWFRCCATHTQTANITEITLMSFPDLQVSPAGWAPCECPQCIQTWLLIALNLHYDFPIERLSFEMCPLLVPKAGDAAVAACANNLIGCMHSFSLLRKGNCLNRSTASASSCFTAPRTLKQTHSMLVEIAFAFAFIQMDCAANGEFALTVGKRR